MFRLEPEDLSTQWMNANAYIRREVISRLEGIERAVVQRSYSASNQVRNSTMIVLSGERSGREYRKSANVVHRASSAGEAPALDTGSFRNSWANRVEVSRASGNFTAQLGIRSDLVVGGKHILGELLEEGTSKMRARPYKQKVIEEALPKVRAIYNRPYNI